MVVSTECRTCRNHMQVVDGKAVKRSKPGTRLANGGTLPVLSAKAAAAEKSAASKVAGKRSFLGGLFDRTPEKRIVSCYHCNFAFETVKEAHSSQCRKCGGYISLKSYEIDHAWRRRIQTRGDVVIQKGASIVGVNVQCHHLTVLGTLAASVECSGDLRIRSHGKILGNVKCRGLRVERGAVVDFQGDVFAERAYIDGQVHGQLNCTGTITLEKKAHLKGLAKAGGLVVKAGAKHTGLMEVVRPKSAQ